LRASSGKLNQVVFVPENKILIIRGGAIGDFILTLPVLAALRQHLPTTRLELLGYPHIAQLALLGRLADAVRPIEARPLAGFFAHGGTLATELADYFASFALILSYLYDPDGIFLQNIARVAKTQFIAGPHRPDDSANLHATEVFLKPLERLAIFAADPVPRLSPGWATRLSRAHEGADLARGERHVLPGHDKPGACLTLALHPGSGSPRKNWPEPKWAELLQHLAARTNCSLLLIGGEAEGDCLPRLAAPLPPDRVALAQSLPLTDLAERLRECAGFAGHDSGISHLAAALGLPTLVLWGETCEAVWRPRGEYVRLVHAGAKLKQLEVKRVLSELLQLVSSAAG
jgi:heptosyltransferase-2